MSEELDSAIEFGDAIFIPSHFTRALVAGGVAIGAAGLSLLAGGYALHELRRTRIEEIVAFVKPPDGG